MEHLINKERTNKQKKVSVVLCTYNGERYIREQIESIISQTYPIHEIIIQDDCSTDSTVSILETYKQKYSNIKLYINKENLGYSNNFKSATMKATGDYIAFSDQDDIWFNDKIEKQIKTIGNNKICFSLCTIGENFSSTSVLAYKHHLASLLFRAIAGHLMLIEKRFVQTKSNWLDFWYYDWGLALQASLKNEIVRIDEPLNWHRIHSSSATHVNNCSKRKTNIFAPYLLGYKKYKTLQKTERWNSLYSYLYQSTKDPIHKLPHRLCYLLLKKDFFSFLSLCILCCKYRKIIYPSEKTNGIFGIIRSFCFPMIYAYHSSDFVP